MPFTAINYATNSQAPVGKWVTTRTSTLGPYDTAPPVSVQHSPSFAGQCVSYVTRVCPSLPVGTGIWAKGALVKDNPSLVAGTAIATFNLHERYEGHAAIYVSQDHAGIHVYDQWIAGNTPKPIGPRLIRWTGHGVANRGDGFYVIEI